MKCPKCQHDVPEGSKFCNQCGYDLNKVVEIHADAYNEPKSYTPKFLADKILKSKSSLIGERKLVTVLFADVANYTSMSEKLDPENIHQIMDSCFKILMDQIHEHKGTINQFTGDGVMALFGAPLALEDHAQDACRAALAIQKAVKKYSGELETQYGIEFKMRIGLNSGPVIVGSIGDDLRMDYTAVGDTTNLASRMEGFAKPGTVLVSPNTYEIVNQQFELKSLGKTEVKGKEDPVEMYELIKDKVHRPRLGQERQIYSEMVGRESDFNKLELQVNKALNGEGSVVNVIGEAGIGKSRLISELRKSSVVKRATFLEGRAISIGRNLSFHPIIDLLKHWSRISEDDSETSSLAKLETAIRSVCQQDADEIIPFVAKLMGMKLSGRYAERVEGIEGEALEKLILKNVKDLITKSTELMPLVIVIEDLHWADTSSIELLESLFRLAETQRVLFINVFRPDHKETGERIVETIKEKLSVYYVEIDLEPLTEQMSGTLIDNMLDIKGLHYGIRDKIVQRAGGNPFFIEEVVRSFIDEGAVIAKDGKFEVTDKIETMVIPHTINDVLMARIDRLEDETKDLVKVASVIGRNFFHKILSEVATSVEDIDNRISHLKEIQLIRERKRMEELEYLFKHALAQEAAYESILYQKRKALHLQVAKSIEKVFKEKLHEFYGLLALHYSKAEDYGNAEHYLVKAGEEALKSSASSEALNYYQKALNLYLKEYGADSDPERVAMMESNIALALHNRGQHIAAVEFFDKAITYYKGNLPKHIFSMIVKSLIGFCHFLISLYLPSLKFNKTPKKKDIEVLNLVVKKCESLTVTDPKRFFIESFYFLKRLSAFDLTKVEDGFCMYGGASVTFSWTGVSFRLSRKVLDFVKDKAEMSNLKFKIRYDVCLSTFDLLTGNWAMAKEYDGALVNQTIRIGELFNTSVYFFVHNAMNIDRGCFQNAQKIIDRESELADVYEYMLSKIHMYEVSLKLKLKQRKLHNIFDEIEEGIDFCNKNGMKIQAFICYIYKAQVQFLLNNIDGAEESILKAKEYFSEAKNIPYYHSVFLLCQFIGNLFGLEEAIQSGKRSAITSNRKKAFLIGKKSVRISKKAANDRTEILKLMGRYYWLIGRQNKAFKWWDVAAKKGEELGARPDLSRTYFEIGKALLDPKCKYKEWKGMSAQEYLEKARTMFQDMDLQYDLDELDKIFSSN